MKPWVPGWFSESVLIVCAVVCLWHGLTLPASVYVVGSVVIGAMRQIERARRASSDAPPPA